MNEWTITGQLHWALGSGGFERSLDQAVFAQRMEATWKWAPLRVHKKKGEERFNLADGGAGTLRASHSVIRTHT